MRAAPAIIVIALLFSGGCVPLHQRESVGLVVFNDSGSAPRLQVFLDGQHLQDLVVAATKAEPPIVSTIHTQLPAGSHRLDVKDGSLVRGFAFMVRSGTRTDVRIHLQKNDIVFAVSYGEQIYM